ncbi:MAG: arabinofuranosyltransferase [Actinomycetota bacterium]|jgi:galactan 5-O-arabinofuranosyltransferase|nr:arabinofuranosyltransferase [Actinomycetota bacterium]
MAFRRDVNTSSGSTSASASGACSAGSSSDRGEWRQKALALRPAVLAVGAFAVAYPLTVFADYNPRSPLLPVAIKAVLAVLVVAVTPMWLARGRLRTWAPDITVALGAAFTGAILAAALHGSVYPAWGWDVKFRVQAVARFSETWDLVDVSYRGLPAFYPPLMPWLVGRAAALFELAPYSAWKHASIVMTFTVPLLSYLLWRRIIGPAVAALVSVGAPLTISVGATLALFYKPDAWLVLFVVIPWWLDAVYGLRRPEVRALPLRTHGLIGAALFCTYYYFFFILALALALLPVLDRLHPPANPRPWRRRLALLGIAAGLSAVYWLPLLMSILEAREPASLQNLWFTKEHTELAVNVFDGSVVGFLMLGGLVHLAWTFRRQRLSAGLLLLLAGGYAWYVLGFFLAAAGRPVLAFKAAEFVEPILVIAGIRAASALVGEATARSSRSDVERVAAVVGVALAFVLGQAYVDDQVADSHIGASHAETRPDGVRQPYAPATVKADDVPAARMIELVWAMHEDEDPPVVLSSRSDFLRISPLYTFNPWHAIYAHPAGEFLARLSFTRRLARERNSQRFAALARTNRFDSIDVFVLKSLARGRLLYEVDSMDFPRPRRKVRIAFSRDQFDSATWQTIQVGEWFMAVPR